MKLSIIIPTREEEKAVGATVRQFAHVSTPHEVIVSDGGSKDKTVEIARSVADKVTVFTGAHHSPSIGRNDGARLAIGEYLVFIDSSVTIPNADSFFKRALQNFESDPRLMGLAVEQWILPDVETASDRFFLTLINWNFRLQNNVLRHGASSGKFQMIKHSAFKQLGGYREDLITAEDLDMMLRLSKIGRTKVDKNLFFYYPGRREHAVGWFKLLGIWMYNYFSYEFLNKSRTKDWTPVR